MEVRIRLTRDTNNSYPCDELILADREDEIMVSITGEEREVRVSKAELRRALLVLTDEGEED